MIIKSMKGYSEKWFYIIIAGIVICVVCPRWLADGMFMDGIIYAILSRNMAEGAGTFWEMHLTDTFSPVFVEHPPLAIGLQSILFNIFGDSRFVERFYSMLTILISATAIVSVWRQIKNQSESGWLPLLFWFSMPLVTWAAVNNMLENTLVIFLCLSVLFYLKSQQSFRIVYLSLAGFMLSCGFLTKGFVAFTPLSLPFFLWLFTGKPKFKGLVTDTIILFISSLLPLLLLFLFTGAREFFPKYFGMAFSKISTGVTADSRFYILHRLVMELLPAIGIIVLILSYLMVKKHSLRILSEEIRLSLVFFSLGMAGVLPILSTMDQSSYFLLTSLPFFALSAGLLIKPVVEMALEKADYSSKGFRAFKLTGILLLTAGIILSFYFSGKTGRDKNKLHDMRIIISNLERGDTINILPQMYDDWSLHCYYARYKDISLDHDLNSRHDYLLIKSDMYSDSLKNEFEELSLNGREYILLRRKQ